MQCIFLTQLYDLSCNVKTNLLYRIRSPWTIQGVTRQLLSECVRATDDRKGSDYLSHLLLVLPMVETPMLSTYGGSTPCSHYKNISERLKIRSERISFCSVFEPTQISICRIYLEVFSNIISYKKSSLGLITWGNSKVYFSLIFNRRNKQKIIFLTEYGILLQSYIGRKLMNEL